MERLRLISEIFANAISRKKTEEALRNSLEEINQLKEQLEAENIYLLDEIRSEHKKHEIITVSDAIRRVLSQVEQVSMTPSTVLIQGETGTGKEVLANAIHNLSPRKERPMVKVNCSALPATLIERELFGHEKGAFSGADSRQPGRFEAADGSTIFLDEISELPLELQPKLLRVLQEGQFERLGSTKTITVNVRVLAATNQELKKLVLEGKFRKDLFYRLNVFPITMPPLRERPDDIPLLVRHFVQEFSRQMGKTINTVPDKVLEDLKKYHWQGITREQHYR